MICCFSVRSVVSLLFASVLGGWSGVSVAEKLKVGFVYVTPVSDAGWTFRHDEGRKFLESQMGDKVTTKAIENVAEGAAAERVIRSLAADGYGLIFTTSFGYMNPTIKVAKKFPKVFFEHATGYKRAKNVGTYVARFYEGRYLAGMVAGSMTKSKVAGYVAAFPIPEVVRGINAFTRGLRSVVPDAEVKVIWVNSWYDPGRERDAADVLIAQGADIVTHHTDSTAVVQAAEKKGVWAVGYHSNMETFGPTAHLTAVTHHWGDHYAQTAAAVLEGRWAPRNVWGGIKDGMIALAPINKAVPRQSVAAVEATRADIAAGRFHPFLGPVLDQAGQPRVASGAVMSDGELAGMDWYVQGVVGELPR